MDLSPFETERKGAALLMVSHNRALAGLFDQSYDLAEVNRAHTSEVSP